MISEQTAKDLAGQTAALYKALAAVLDAAAGTPALAAHPSVAHARAVVRAVDCYLARAAAEDPKAVLGSRRRNGEYTDGESEGPPPDPPAAP